MDYRIKNWHPVHPSTITKEHYDRLPKLIQDLYEREQSATVQPPDREENAYYPFTDDANRTDDPEAPYKQKNSEL